MLHGYDQIGMHFRMLSDRIRMDTFQRAIFNVVKPGDVVCDFGTGSGVLAMLACRAGASKVYAIDRSNFIKTAAELCKANGFEDRITFLRTDARTADLPEAVDVLISEWLGNAALEENMLPPLIGLRDRVLKPEGLMLPGIVRIMAAPVRASERFEQITFFSESICDLDFQGLANPSAQERFWAHIKPEELIGEPLLVTELDMRTVSNGSLAETISLQFSEQGLCHGIALWFDAEVSPGVSLPTGPHAARTHWRQVVFPIGPRAIEVLPGHQMEVKISAHGAGTDVEWSWSIGVKTDITQGFQYTFSSS
ncbi:ribosomal protein L11 methyltransferase [Ruegeria meonggei]|uniref:Ribosomal protein L11 methyltransferase n=2 Tax=Ruegeria meonggei TaxID=1446476 RepID=A0A1X6ZLM1_9RHOB|nr:ribosomal protein L11 methyltransferase [Ruegeria meonggei]